MMIDDGLYQVTTSYLCAGFEVKNGKVIACAPILRKKLGYWMTIAKKIPPSYPKTVTLE